MYESSATILEVRVHAIVVSSNTLKAYVYACVCLYVFIPAQRS